MYKKDIQIAAAPEQVFAYVADLARHPEWASNELKIEARSEGAVGVGSKFSSVGHQFGKDNPDEVTVHEYAPSKRFVFDSEDSSGVFRHTFELTPEGEGTRVIKSCEVLSAAMKTKLLTPVLAVLIPKALSKDLQQIKSRLE